MDTPGFNDNPGGFTSVSHRPLVICITARNALELFTHGVFQIQDFSLIIFDDISSALDNTGGLIMRDYYYYGMLDESKGEGEV